jgi:hypothetical protein
MGRGTLRSCLIDHCATRLTDVMAELDAPT